MQQTEPLTYGNYYHIYNRGIDSCNLFRETDNYEYFLSLFDKYISPVADTFAWVLMPNHFHFLVRLKQEVEVELPATPDRVQNPVRGNALMIMKILLISPNYIRIFQIHLQIKRK